MIKNSSIIVESNINSGIGRYAWNLYNLGFFENFMHFAYNGKSDFENYITFSKYWKINTIISYYIGGPFKSYVKKYKFIHLSSPFIFHLAKYNQNIVGTIHDLFPIQYLQKKDIKNWFIKNLKFIPKLKGVIVISDHIKRQIEEMYKEVEFTRIHHWIDDKNFKPRDRMLIREKLNLDKEKIYLLNVSRDVPRKNIDLLPKIMNNLDDRFILIRIGETNRIIDKFKNRNQVIPLINVDESVYPLYFNASNLLIHTSIDGGFEIPFIEAIFSDLPVISFDIPISREVLRDKGIFVKFDKDDPNEWVEMIYKYYDKRIDYGELKEYYRPERAKKEYENFYKKIGWL